MSTETRNSKRQTGAPDYDSAWKDVIEEHFESFLEFFFPHIHRDVDFSKGYEFLSQELRDIMPDGKVGKRYADELVKVHLKDGSVKCIALFIHIEVQGQKEKHFPERIYVYNYRIYDKSREGITEVISLVIMTDEDPNYRPDEYVVSRWGFELRMKIPIVKIIDYQLDEEKRKQLETSTNPMAMVVKAQLQSYEAKKANPKKKFDVKLELIRHCYQQGYTKAQVITLLKFIDWIIRIPGEYQQQLKQEISKIEEEHKMPYVTSWERTARQEGLEMGQQMGLKQGKQMGLKEGEKRRNIEIARKSLKEGLSADLVARLTGLSREEIDKLAGQG